MVESKVYSLIHRNISGLFGQRLLTEEILESVYIVITPNKAKELVHHQPA
jgi:hypothetical protein